MGINGIPPHKTLSSLNSKKFPAAESPQKAAPGDRLTLAGVQEPSSKVSEPLPYSTKPALFQRLRDTLESFRQSSRADEMPGTLLCRNSNGGTAGIRQLREKSPFERDLPIEGLKKEEKAWVAPKIANPNDPEGFFDPYAFLPDILFDPKEDSFPVLPDSDGDGKVKDDAGHYRHGVIGGDQPLRGSFSVAKKGEYTVLTYSFFYVDNKFTNYHLTDSSTFAVYLKPGKDGKLKPESLYTSWHYGGNLASWDDLKKGPDGRPVILVERGSHALHPYSKGEKLPSKGLSIQGNGKASLDGKALANRLTWVSPNPDVRNATMLDSAKDRVVLNAYYSAYPERTHPIHPVLFEKKGKK